MSVILSLVASLVLLAAFAEASTFAKATADRSAPRQAAAPLQTPTPTNQSPAATPPPADPASSQFTADTGILLVTIKPTAIADYEEVIRTLQKALAGDQDPARQAAAKGWRVFRAAEADAKGNAIFIHVMMPAAPNFDYRPSLLLDELVKDLAPDLLVKYQDAFAAAPTKLNLTEFAAMSMMPVEPAKKPGGF
jgi:hypothetical protein